MLPRYYGGRMQAHHVRPEDATFFRRDLPPHLHHHAAGTAVGCCRHDTTGNTLRPSRSCAKCPAHRAKIFRFPENQKQAYSPRHPARMRGVSRSSRFVVRAAMDAIGSQAMRNRCVRSSRVVVVPRCWDQARGQVPGATEANKPGTPARARSKP